MIFVLFFSFFFVFSPNMNWKKAIHYSFIIKTAHKSISEILQFVFLASDNVVEVFFFFWTWMAFLWSHTIHIEFPQWLETVFLLQSFILKNVRCAKMLMYRTTYTSGQVELILTGRFFFFFFFFTIWALLEFGVGVWIYKVS